jgi:hypothetical protein
MTIQQYDWTVMSVEKQEIAEMCKRLNVNGYEVFSVLVDDQTYRTNVTYLIVARKALD